MLKERQRGVYTEHKLLQLSEKKYSLKILPMIHSGIAK